jgi:hypothetical protein
LPSSIPNHPEHQIERKGLENQEHPRKTDKRTENSYLATKPIKQERHKMLNWGHTEEERNFRRRWNAEVSKEKRRKKIASNRAINKQLAAPAAPPQIIAPLVAKKGVLRRIS